MKTILIVEDHAGLRKTLGDWLRAVFPHCTVIEAASGEDAIACTHATPANDIVMDIGLPGMNGIETTRTIRTMRPETGIVMLSMYEEDSYVEAARSAGASAFVFKRTMQTELVPVLQDLLSDIEKAEKARVSG